jgi:hypothetical protein
MTLANPASRLYELFYFFQERAYMELIIFYYHN